MSTHSPGTADKRATWKHLIDVFLVLTWRDFAPRYRHTTFGVVYTFLQPITYSILFHLILKNGRGHSPGIAHLFVGFCFWQFLAMSYYRGTTCLTDKHFLVRHTNFPRLVIPMTCVLATFMDLALMVPACIVAGYHSLGGELWHLIGLPFTLATSILFCFGVASFVSLATVRFRDIIFLLPFVSQFWMLASPVLYSMNSLHGWFKLIWLNPAAGILTLARWSLLGEPILNPQLLALSLLVGAFFTLLSIWHFLAHSQDLAELL